PASEDADAGSVLGWLVGVVPLVISSCAVERTTGVTCENVTLDGPHPGACQDGARWWSPERRLSVLLTSPQRGPAARQVAGRRRTTLGRRRRSAGPVSLPCGHLVPTPSRHPPRAQAVKDRFVASAPISRLSPSRPLLLVQTPRSGRTCVYGRPGPLDHASSPHEGVPGRRPVSRVAVTAASSGLVSAAGAAGFPWRAGSTEPPLQLARKCT